MPPARTTRTTSHRRGPYNKPSAPVMTSAASTYYPQHSMPLLPNTTTDWPNPLYPMQHHLMPISDVMCSQASATPHLPPSNTPHLPRPASPRPTQSGPWSSEEDRVLEQAHKKGLGWGQVQEQHFPGKSANACRKRYERLQTKRRSTDWDDVRLESVAVAYREVRSQMWSLIAARTGEKWEHVEKACMRQGLKNLQNLAATHQRNLSNRSNSSSRLGNISGSEESWYSYAEEQDQDDSGIGGMGINGNINGNINGSQQLSVPDDGNGSNWKDMLLQQPQVDNGSYHHGGG